MAVRRIPPCLILHLPQSLLPSGHVDSQEVALLQLADTVDAFRRTQKAASPINGGSVYGSGYGSALSSTRVISRSSTRQASPTGRPPSAARQMSSMSQRRSSSSSQQLHPPTLRGGTFSHASPPTTPTRFITSPSTRLENSGKTATQPFRPSSAPPLTRQSEPGAAISMGESSRTAGRESPILREAGGGGGGGEAGGAAREGGPLQLLGEDTATIDEECERINMGSGLSHFTFEGPRDSSVSFYARSRDSGRASSDMSVEELSSSHPRGWKKALAGGREMTEEVSRACCQRMHTLASRCRRLWRDRLVYCHTQPVL